MLLLRRDGWPKGHSLAASDEPTEKYLQEISNDIPPLWAGRNQRINEVRTARKHLNRPQTPTEIQKLTKLPPPENHAVEDLLRHTQGLYASQLPRATRDPLDPLDTEDKLAAEAISTWLNGSYELIRPTYYQMTDAFPQDGQAVIKDVLLEHRFRTRQNAKEPDAAYLKRLTAHRRDPMNFPFVTEHIDTTMWFPVSDDLSGGPGIHGEVMVKTERERAPTYRQYEKDIRKAYEEPGRVIDPNFGSSGSGAYCEHVEVWNREWFAIMIDGLLVRKGRHKYRRPPFFDPDFSTTSMKDRKYLTEGIADPLVSVQNQLEAIDTLFQAWAHFSALPRFRFRPINIDDLQPIPADFKISLGPFEVVGGPPGWYVEQLDLQDIGETLMNWRRAVIAEKDELSLAPILLGKLEQTQAGPTASAMLDVAKSILAVSHGNMRGAFNDLARHRLYCIDKILKEPVPIEYYDPADKDKKHTLYTEIGPEQIQGNYRVSHEIEPVTAAERAIELQIANALYERGIVDKHFVAVKAGIPEPEKMLEQRRLEDFAEAGPTQQKITQMAYTLYDMMIGELGGGEIVPPAGMAGEGTPEAVRAGMSGPYVPQIAGGGVNPGQIPVDPAAATVGMNPAEGMVPVG